MGVVQNKIDIARLEKILSNGISDGNEKYVPFSIAFLTKNVNFNLDGVTYKGYDMPLYKLTLSLDEELGLLKIEKIETFNGDIKTELEENVHTIGECELHLLSTLNESTFTIIAYKLSDIKQLTQLPYFLNIKCTSKDNINTGEIIYIMTSTIITDFKNDSTFNIIYQTFVERVTIKPSQIDYLQIGIII